MGALAQSLPPGVCERCGGGNSPQARFCQHCGTPLGSDDPVGWYERVEAVPSGDEGSPAPPGTGAIVSAVVCELAPASSVESDDPPWSAASGPAEVPPEALDKAREILRRHGATVEDLAGTTDTLAAVFGPEPADGDGPARAARAVAELRQALEGAVAVARASAPLRSWARAPSPRVSGGDGWWTWRPVYSDEPTPERSSWRRV